MIGPIRPLRPITGDELLQLTALLRKAGWTIAILDTVGRSEYRIRAFVPISAAPKRNNCSHSPKPLQAELFCTDSV